MPYSKEKRAIAVAEEDRAEREAIAQVLTREHDPHERMELGEALDHNELAAQLVARLATALKGTPHTRALYTLARLLERQHTTLTTLWERNQHEDRLHQAMAGAGHSEGPLG